PDSPRSTVRRETPHRTGGRVASWIGRMRRSADARIGRSLEASAAEAQSDRGIDVVALEKAVSQSAILLREHDPEIEIPLRSKLPIDNSRVRVQRTGALRARAAGTWRRPGRGAEEGILDVMVIGGDHIQFIGDGVFHAGPHDVQNPVTKTVHTEGCIVNIRVVERDTAQAKKGSRDIGKSK